MEDSAPLSLGSSVFGDHANGNSDYSFSDQFNLRLGTQNLLLGLDDVEQTILPAPGKSYVTPDAVVDFYPFQSVFRLSGGFLYDPDPFESATSERNEITLGGLPFTPSRGGALPGALNFNAYTPYAGLGVQSSLWSGRLQFALDFGLQFESESGPDNNDDPALANSDDAEAAQDNFELLGFSPRAGVTVKLSF